MILKFFSPMLVPPQNDNTINSVGIVVASPPLLVSSPTITAHDVMLTNDLKTNYVEELFL